MHKYDIKVRDKGVSKTRPLKRELQKLYIGQKLSTRKIANICGCSRSTVHRKLKRYGIKRRNLAESEIKYPRKNFSDNLTEKAYLIGFALGDLRVRKQWKNSNTIGVACGSTQLAQIQLIHSLFSKYGRVWSGKTLNGRYNIEAYLDLSFSFLLQPENELKWIQSNREYFLSFLSGFTDAEGSIFMTNNRLRYTLSNYNKNLLEFTKKNLKKHFNIEANIYTDRKLRITNNYIHNDYCKFLSVHKKQDLLYLLKLLENNIKHRDKLWKLKTLKENIYKGDTIQRRI